MKTNFIPKVTLSEVELNRCLNDPDYLIKKFFLNQKYCMAYNKNECKGKIIKAHTVSKKYLRNISDSGHVYMPKSSSHNKTNFWEINQVGLKEATTFYGFCQFHDDELFKSFEKNNFNGQYNQVYELTYRALTREYFDKICYVNLNKMLKRGELETLNQTDYIKTSDFQEMYRNSLRDKKDLELLYEQINFSRNNGLCYLTIETDKLPICGNGVYRPLMNINGKKIQEQNGYQHSFIHNIIPLEERTIIIICSAKSSKCKHMIKDFLAPLEKEENSTLLLNYILTSLLFTSTNIAFNPTWYSRLEHRFKNELLRLVNHNVGNYYGTFIQEELDFCSTLDNPQILRKQKHF